MFWEKIGRFLKSIWGRICNPRINNKINTLLDTVSLKLFGLNIKITREIPSNVPYELTVVVPRAEVRGNKNNGTLEIILSSITIAHSPRFERKPAQGNSRNLIPIAA